MRSGPDFLRKFLWAWELSPLGTLARLFVVRVFGGVLFVGAGQFFEQVGVLDWGRDLVVAGGPFAEVEQAAAVGAEGEALVGGEDDLAAGGAEEGFRGGHGNTDCNFLDDGVQIRVSSSQRHAFDTYQADSSSKVRECLGLLATVGTGFLVIH